MWAIDLGTTNTLLAKWDERAGRPAMVELPKLSRSSAPDAAPESARTVPSAVQVLDEPTWSAKLGESTRLLRRFRFGHLATIGKPALDANTLRQHPGFVPSFKRVLSMAPLRTVARAGGTNYSAREVAYMFLRQLLAEAERETGDSIRELVFTSPVEAFESYRAELAEIGKRAGLKKVHFLDEPVAAALGYGLGLERDRKVMVVDFGGGTFHLALLQMGFSESQKGRSTVLAKIGDDMGGNLVDQWLLDTFLERLGYEPFDTETDEGRLWRGLMVAEACRVKEAVYFHERARFELTPPEDRRRFEAALRGAPATLEVSRADLVGILEEKGLYRALDRCFQELMRQAQARGIGDSDIDDVLMVGGSTLLPEVYGFFEKRLGRGRVRAWQPFEAVAFGASVFAGGRVTPGDFIVHDYALRTHDLKTGKPDHTIVIPKGTSFPTKPDFWRRQLVPTCALGEPERVFKLVVCELGRGAGADGFRWDVSGRVLRAGTSEANLVVVPLNEANPALGFLDPPHSPSDASARLDVSLGVNADRWLCATVVDLKTRKQLLKNEPVTRLV